MPRDRALAAAVGTLVCRLLLTPSAAPGCTFFELVREGPQIRLLSRTLDPGSSRRLELGGTAGTIALVVAVQPGMSGDVVGPRYSKPLLVRCDGETLHVATATEPVREILAATPAELGALRHRIDVRAWDGTKAQYRLDGWSVVSAAEGPAVDLFAGRIPLTAGDYSITTTTERRPDVVPAARGGFALTLRGGYLVARGSLDGGGEASWIVDLGSAMTLIDPTRVPRGATLEALTMVEASAEGRRAIPFVAGGAGGSLAGGLRSFRAASLALGSVTFARPELVVGPPLPAKLRAVVGEDLAGILGMDLLGSAGTLEMAMPRAETAGSLALGAAPDGGAGGWQAVPVRRVGETLVASARVDGVPVALVVDTGSPVTIVDAKTPRRRDEQGATRPVSGIDAARLELEAVRLGRVELGPIGLGELSAWSGALPVLDKLSSEQAAGVLGMDVLAGFKGLRLDLDGPRLALRR